MLAKNNASLIEAGFTRGIPSTCLLMRWLHRNRNDERILS